MSPFAAMFSKAVCCRNVTKRLCVGMVKEDLKKLLAKGDIAHYEHSSLCLIVSKGCLLQMLFHNLRVGKG